MRSGSLLFSFRSQARTTIDALGGCTARREHSAKEKRSRLEDLDRFDGWHEPGSTAARVPDVAVTMVTPRLTDVRRAIAIAPVSIAVTRIRIAIAVRAIAVAIGAVP